MSPANQTRTTSITARNLALKVWHSTTPQDWPHIHYLSDDLADEHRFEFRLHMPLSGTIKQAIKNSDGTFTFTTVSGRSLRPVASSKHMQMEVPPCDKSAIANAKPTSNGNSKRSTMALGNLEIGID